MPTLHKRRPRTAFDARPVESPATDEDAIERRPAAGVFADPGGRYEAILRAIPDMMFVQAPDGTYLDYHAADPSLLLMPPEQFLGKSMHELLPPDLAARFQRAFDEVLETGSTAVIEYSLEMPSGTRHYESRLVSCDGGRGILAIVRDVTDRRQTEEALRRAQIEAVNTARLSWMGVLAASLSHEINQPLTAIEANASAGLHWIATSNATADVNLRELLIDIRAGAHRASAVIQRTLDLFSRQPIGRVAIHPREVVDAALAMMSPTLLRARVDVRVHIADTVPNIFVDRAMVLQVLVTLIGNLVESMGESGDRSLDITSASGSDGFVHVTIERPGFDSAHGATGFEPIHTPKAGHVGIGLSISRAIAEAHGGGLRAVSRPRLGGAFDLTLPAVPISR
jgi:PAS domain S-box-containing protein